MCECTPQEKRNTVQIATAILKIKKSVDMSDSVVNEVQSVVLGVMNAASTGEASDLLDDFLMNRDREESHLLLGITIFYTFYTNYYDIYFNMSSWSSQAAVSGRISW